MRDRDRAPAAEGKALSTWALWGFLAGCLISSAVLLIDPSALAVACSSGGSFSFGSGDQTFTDAALKNTSASMGGGNDHAEMGDCNDIAFGGTGGDQLHGAFGIDEVWGNAGNDHPSVCGLYGCGKLFGGADRDTVDGGPGNDDLDDSQAGFDQDTLRGTGDNDTLNTMDGDSSDTADGGAGSDACFADSGDTKISC